MLTQLLADNFTPLLQPIEESCSSDLHACFGHLTDDVWGALLTKDYEGWPRIKAALPDWPEEAIQRRFVGSFGLPQFRQNVGFTRNVKGAYRTYGPRPLAESVVLDFGVGWGRLIRYMAKDVRRQNLLGCDPQAEILELCRATRVPGELRTSDWNPRNLPFDGPIDLVYAFSVFTHLAEEPHRGALAAIEKVLSPGGILILTVRPRGMLEHMGVPPEEYDHEPFIYRDKPKRGPEPIGVYGDAVITDRYIRENWTGFDVVDQWWMADDALQVAYVLRKR